MHWLLIGGAAVALFLATSPEARRMAGLAAPDLVRQLAAQWGGIWGVAPAWIVAIAKVESGWRPGATNTTGGDAKRGGAWGLMQLTLATAQSLAPRARKAAGTLPPATRAAVIATLNKWDGTGPGLTDPAVNICLGAFMLADLSRSFGGNFERATAAYNRGAAAVTKMVASKQDVAGLAYVQKVKAVIA